MVLMQTGGIHDGAFSEGLGDIMSLLMTRSNLLGIGFMVQNGAPVRDLEPNKIYPRDRGEVHAEGLIIASTFWDLYKALAKKYDSEDKSIDLLSKYIFKGIYTARKYTELYDAMLVIDDDDSDVSNATPNTCVINKIFSDHGLAKSLSWCELAVVKEYEIKDEDGDGILEPGQKAEIFLNAYNPSSETLTSLTGRISSRSPNLVIEQDKLVWEPIAGNSTSKSTIPAKVFVKTGTTCGSEFKMNFRLSDGSREVSSEYIFTVGKNQGTSEVFAASDLPKDIRDYQRTISTVSVGGEQWENNAKVFKAHLKFEIGHSYIGDLIITLISPAGKKFQVYKGRGGADQIVYDKDISNIVGPATGKGDWKLEVYDKASRDQGSLKSFSLDLTPKYFVCD